MKRRRAPRRGPDPEATGLNRLVYEIAPDNPLPQIVTMNGSVTGDGLQRIPVDSSQKEANALFECHIGNWSPITGEGRHFGPVCGYLRARHRPHSFSHSVRCTRGGVLASQSVMVGIASRLYSAPKLLYIRCGRIPRTQCGGLREVANRAGPLYLQKCQPMAKPSRTKSYEEALRILVDKYHLGSSDVENISPLIAEAFAIGDSAKDAAEEIGSIIVQMRTRKALN